MDYLEQEDTGVLTFPLLTKKKKQVCLVYFGYSFLVITLRQMGSLRGFYRKGDSRYVDLERLLDGIDSVVL